MACITLRIDFSKLKNVENCVDSMIDLIEYTNKFDKINNCYNEIIETNNNYILINKNCDILTNLNIEGIDSFILDINGMSIKFDKSNSYKIILPCSIMVYSCIFIYFDNTKNKNIKITYDKYRVPDIDFKKFLKYGCKVCYKDFNFKFIDGTIYDLPFYYCEEIIKEKTIDKLNIIKEELISKSCHPDRIFNWNEDFCMEYPIEYDKECNKYK